MDSEVEARRPIRRSNTTEDLGDIVKKALYQVVEVETTGADLGVPDTIVLARRDIASPVITGLAWGSLLWLPSTDAVCGDE